MTKADSSRIQSSQAKSGNYVGKNSFSSRAQSSADKSANSGGATEFQVSAKYFLIVQFNNTNDLPPNIRGDICTFLTNSHWETYNESTSQFYTSTIQPIDEKAFVLGFYTLFDQHKDNLRIVHGGVDWDICRLLLKFPDQHNDQILTDIAGLFSQLDFF